MNELIGWAGFLGAWLLFAGPIYQASIELGEEQIEREAIEATARRVPRSQEPSAWWWLIPPIGYLVDRRQAASRRELVFAALSREHQEQFVHYTEKASGWAYVAGGALLLAASETWSLVADHEWPGWSFWAIAGAMTALCGLVTALRSRRAKAMLGESPAGRGGQPRQGQRGPEHH